jgi:hypothetical protein
MNEHIVQKEIKYKTIVDRNGDANIGLMPIMMLLRVFKYSGNIS